MMKERIKVWGKSEKNTNKMKMIPGEDDKFRV